MTSLTGEKASVNQVIDAFDRVTRELGVDLDHYKAEADGGRSRYIFYVESERRLSPGLLRSLLASLDATLMKLNLENAAKRKSRRLGAPILELMAPGWYEQHKRRRLADQRRIFQAKGALLEARESGDGDEQKFVIAEVRMDRR